MLDRLATIKMIQRPKGDMLAATLKLSVKISEFNHFNYSFQPIITVTFKGDKKSEKSSGFSLGPSCRFQVSVHNPEICEEERGGFTTECDRG